MLNGLNILSLNPFLSFIVYNKPVENNDYE